MSDVDSTLNKRGERYGNYSDVASTTQQLMAIVECGANYEHLNAEQKTSLFMICNKIARAVNGDPQYFDNYRDIAGYATLAERACEAVEAPRAILEAEKSHATTTGLMAWMVGPWFVLTSVERGSD